MSITLPFKLKDLVNPDDELKKLDKLIKKYNEKPSLLQLELIDAQTRQLRQRYSQEFPSYSTEFMRWLLRDPIRAEIALLAPRREDPSALFFALNGPVQRDSLDFKAYSRKLWNITTQKNECIGQEFDRLLRCAEQAKNAATQEPFDHSSYLKILEDLKALTLHSLNSSDKKLQKETKPFTKLLGHIHWEIMGMFLSQKLPENNQYLPVTTPIPELRSLIHNTPEFNDFVLKLKENTPLTLGNFELKPLGGNNNKNWLAKNDETGEYYIVRLEKLLPDLVLRDIVEQTPEIKKYLAQDFLFYPTELIASGNFMETFNVALSEFCPKKDLLSYRYMINGEPLESIIDQVLDMTMQIADFAIALNNRELAYTDFKPENFLLRENGQVVTADRKSITKQNEQGHLILNGPGSVAITFKAPEHMEISSGAAEFMAYEIAVTLYILMAGDQVAKPLGTGSYKDNVTGFIADFNFDYPIFQTARGQEIKTVIEQLMDPNPTNRPPLTAVVEQLKALSHRVDMQGNQRAEEIEDEGEDIQPRF